MRRGLTRLFGLGVVAAMLFGLWRAWSGRTRDALGNQEWESGPFPFPPVPRPRPEASRLIVPPEVEPGGGPETERSGEVAVESLAAWIEPIEGACPASHPIKAKLASGIYHQPGGMNYTRTRPDRCYLDADAAERDGLRPSKM
jgi:hypothetical protein